MQSSGANNTSVTESNHGETVIAEWHRETERTFTIDEVKRWFKIAIPLMKAAHDAPGGNMMSALDDSLTDVWESISELLANDARAELAALRASEQYWQQTAETERANATEQRERAEILGAIVEVQERQLEQARMIIIGPYEGHGLTSCACNFCRDRRTWIAANAPAPQAQPAQCMTSEVESE